MRVMVDDEVERPGVEGSCNSSDAQVFGEEARMPEQGLVPGCDPGPLRLQFVG